MPIELSWREPDLIHFSKYSGKVNRDEFIEALDNILSIIESAEHPIHFMVDVRETQSFSVGQIQGIPQIMHMVRHKNFGWIAMVGVHSSFAFWLKVFIKLANLRYANFSTVEEGEQFLREVHRIHVVRA